MARMTVTTQRTIVKMVRDLVEDIERRGVITEMCNGSGENEVITFPNFEKGYMEARPGPRRSFTLTLYFADVEPAGEGETSSWRE